MSQHETALQTNLRWLLLEYVLAAGLCGLAVAWAGELSSDSLRHGLLLAALLLFPAEAFRQFTNSEVLQRFLSVRPFTFRAEPRRARKQREILGEQADGLRRAADALRKELAQLRLDFQPSLELHGHLDTLLGFLRESEARAEHYRSQDRVTLAPILQHLVEVFEVETNRSQQQQEELAEALQGIRSSLRSLERMAETIQHLDRRLASFEDSAHRAVLTGPQTLTTPFSILEGKRILAAVRRSQEVEERSGGILEVPLAAWFPASTRALAAKLHHHLMMQSGHLAHEELLLKREAETALPLQQTIYRFMLFIASRQRGGRRIAALEEELARILAELERRQE